MSDDSKYEVLKSEILNLIDDWDEQTKEFRRLSLVSNDPIEVARMRAKADTLHYRRGELIVALGWAEDKTLGTKSLKQK